MVTTKQMLLIFALVYHIHIPLLHAQSQKGFISIDCGLSPNSVYTEKETGINYTSDESFTDAGVSYSISAEYISDALERHFLTVRSFPQGFRNCYTIKRSPGDFKFLIRASFMYGNYDGKNEAPRFSLLLGTDEWDSVELRNSTTIVHKEIIYAFKINQIDVCLENRGSGTPFISALELRPMHNDTYDFSSDIALLLHSRLDIGSTVKPNETYGRFKADVYDRIWTPYTKSDWVTLTTPLVVAGQDYNPPSEVMQTAATPANTSNSLVLKWDSIDPKTIFYKYFFWAELDKNQTRNQSIYFNGQLYAGPRTPKYLSPVLAYDYEAYQIGKEELELSIKKTEDSLFPPILNAFELYTSKPFLQSFTNQEDADAIKNVKKEYGVKKNWQGDPCLPAKYSWHGLNCTYTQDDLPRITSLNLSSSGISGEISLHISSLVYMYSLDLSNNNLTGPIPDFLAQLQYLIKLNLRGNHLEGSVPAPLVAKWKNQQLLLSVDGNPDLCLSTSCKTNKNGVVVPVLASFLAVLVLVAASFALFILKTRIQGILWRRKSNGSLDPKSRRFSYIQVLKITNNFEKIIGQGGFGTVYHGILDDNEVAVKMLSPSSVQGYKQFQTEVELLLRIHHKNLTTLIGYCDDETHVGLIYEFMANGNVESHLLDEGSTTADVLSWEGRLRIAAEAAQGLEYLHSNCRPSIIHRDVKPSNILLSEKFEAKIADFGLSRIFQSEQGTHVSTVVAGTLGYLDPEYYRSNRLTEKSDVYSFGVVLLQLVTSKPAIINFESGTHIVQWTRSMLADWGIEGVVDRRLLKDFNINSARRVVEVALVCVSENSVRRPTMNQIVNDLNECLAIQIAPGNINISYESHQSKDALPSQVSVNLDSMSGPLNVNTFSTRA